MGCRTIADADLRENTAMTYEIVPADVAVRIESLVASGEYASRDDVLRDALSALSTLAKQKQYLAELQESYDELEAGKGVPFEDVDRRLREKYDFLRDL
jgi:Arc/MetJ-type ribon-helix-helix transcriptional regulator